jgi:hypothetical protein
MERVQTSSLPTRASGSSPLKWAYETTLNFSVVIVSGAFALGYLKQPRFITEYARGPLFLRVYYIKGMIVGAVSFPVLICCSPCLVLLTIVCPCVVCPVFVALKCGTDIAQGSCLTCGKNGEGCDVVMQLLSKMAALGLVVAVQGALMRQRIVPEYTSGFFGYAATTFVIGTMITGAGRMAARTIVAHNPDLVARLSQHNNVANFLANLNQNAG